MSDISKIYISEDKKYILKKIILFLEYDTYKREVLLLKKLNKEVDWTPKIIYNEDKDNIIVSEYCGERINEYNKPNNYKEQINKIIFDLKRLNIQHNDLKIEEILVKNNKIYICDFGWGSINNKHDCCANLWSGVKPFGYFREKDILNKLDEYLKINKYMSNDRNNVGSQCEIPKIIIKDKDIYFTGYQYFSINNTSIKYYSKIDKYNKLRKILLNFKKDCHSLIDIGCSNGLVSFISNKIGYDTLALDHDSECINIIKKTINILSIKNLKAQKYSFGDNINVKCDIVIMLALVHWIYSCTSLYGNFDDIFIYLKPYINKYLMIEWIHPNDDAIQSFNHINYNKSIHREEYNTPNFEKSLIKNIGNIINKIELEGSTRILYIVKKNYY